LYKIELDLETFTVGYLSILMMSKHVGKVQIETQVSLMSSTPSKNRKYKTGCQVDK
jgi:hypothetical protein